MEHFVYFLAKEARLIITNNKIDDKNYLFLFSSGGRDSYRFCQTYCCGMVYGNTLGISDLELTNTLEEFSKF